LKAHLQAADERALGSVATIAVLGGGYEQACLGYGGSSLVAEGFDLPAG